MKKCSLCNGRKVIRDTDELDPHGHAWDMVFLLIKPILIFLALLAALIGSVVIGARSVFVLLRDTFFPPSWTAILWLLIFCYLFAVSLYTIYRSIWPKYITCHRCGGCGLEQPEGVDPSS